MMYLQSKFLLISRVVSYHHNIKVRGVLLRVGCGMWDVTQICPVFAAKICVFGSFWPKLARWRETSPFSIYFSLCIYFFGDGGPMEDGVLCFVLSIMLPR